MFGKKMRNRSTVAAGLALAAGLGFTLLGGAVALYALAARAAEPQGASEFARFAVTTPATTAGQSATLLPDGRWMFIGGRRGKVPIADISIRDVRTTQQPSVPAFSAKLIYPRFAHTATVLPDGTVLVLGGIDFDGAAVAAAEVIDPLSGEIRVVNDSGLHPRSRHAATLLTNGYVLVTGGVSQAGQVLQDAELWNPDTQYVEPLANALSEPRSDHVAALLANGRGLIWGGQNAAGQPIGSGETYDPTNSKFDVVNPTDESALPPAYLRDAPPSVEASLPEPNATDVPVNTRIAARFSKPLRVESANESAVTLVGPAGAVNGKVVGAGAGLLVFFTPDTDLLPGATYTLFMRGLVDAQGQPLPWSALSFTTQNIAASSAAPIAPRANGASTGASSSQTASATAPIVKQQEPKKAEPRKDTEKKRPAEEEKAANGDEFEDWIPGEHHRHGQWRVLGTRNEPRTTKVLIAPAALKAAPKTTALAGRVLRLNGVPLEGVRVSTSTASTLTDAQGRFLLSGIPAGAHEITIDGSGVTSEGRRYATHFIRVQALGKRTTEMQPIYLARLNPANDRAIPSPADRDIVLTHPDIPGLEIHIPKGAVLRTRDGRIVTTLNIAPLPVDRVPFAVPEGFPVYFTVQPAGAFIDNSATGKSMGIRVIYPNYLGAAADTRVTFWNYDPTGEGWQVYGQGTVTSDAKQIVPDQGVVQRNLMAFGYSFDNTGNAPAEGPPPGSCAKAGDPVDCATGLFVHSVTDLFIADTIPLALTRTYRTKDTISRDFGIGANHSYGMFLSNPTGSANPPAVDLVLPDGGRVRFQRIVGSSVADSVYQHSATPTAWQGATLRINVPADRFEITTRDKTVYQFSDHVTNALVGIRDRYGNTVSIARLNNSGRITQITSPNGRYLAFEYDAANRIRQVRDNIGRTVRYEYDTEGRLWKATDPDNKVEQYTYDSAHRMTTVIDKRGNTMVTNVYDSNGRVQQQTLADNAVWGFAYTLNAAGKVSMTTVTNPRGYVTQMSFNDSGYLTQVVHAVGQPEQQTYTFGREAGSNLRLTATDPLNRVTKTTYDHMGRATSVTRLFGTPDAVTASTSYESTFGGVASFTDPLDHQTLFDYDSSGNLISITDPLGHANRATYDARGLLVAVTDALGKTSRIDYEQGDVAAFTDPLNRTLSFFSDSVGRMIGVSDFLSNNTRFEYDPLNRVLRTIDSRGGVTSMTYDANSNVRTVRDARDLGTHEFTYDARNRVKTYTDPLGETETYNYDGMGNLISKLDRKNQTTSYVYDALNRLKTITYADSSSITLTWDGGNRVRQFTDSASGTITQDYDGLDRLTRETSPQGQVDYAYDNAGRRTQLTVAGQPPVTYDYDDADRLTQIMRGTSAVDLTYDAANRRSTMTLPNGIVGSYGFDDADQLLSINYSQGSTHVAEVAYTYDAAGRRVGQTGSLAKVLMPPTVTATSYDTANRLTSWGANSLTYDDNGNLESFGSATYQWNARDQLASTSAGSASFTYDGLQRRSGRTVNSTTTSYLHDLLNPVRVNGDFMLDGPNLDEIYAQVSASGTTSFVSDGLGSTRLLSDGNGAVTTAYSYSPFGAVARTGSGDTPFQFTGRENDGASGLYYYRARYYNPVLNRFISEDPIGLSGGINVYAYVEGSPVDSTDPEGLEGPGSWNSPETLGSWKQDPCINAALIDSVLNITPFVGFAKAVSEEATSLDVVSSGASSAATVTWYASRRSEANANRRLAELRRWDRARREQAWLKKSVAADRAMFRKLKLFSKVLGLTAIPFEIANFSDAVEKCACQQQ
jgi:RHS repeat-associated protein